MTLDLTISGRHIRVEAPEGQHFHLDDEFQLLCLPNGRTFDADDIVHLAAEGRCGFRMGRSTQLPHSPEGN
jgi:hypothetical protein